MEKAGEAVLEAIGWVGKLLLFVLLSVIFLPSFLVVNYLQKPWAEMLESLF
jgi:hypothetical protein